MPTPLKTWRHKALTNILLYNCFCKGQSFHNPTPPLGAQNSKWAGGRFAKTLWAGGWAHLVPPECHRTRHQRPGQALSDSTQLLTLASKAGGLLYTCTPSNCFKHNGVPLKALPLDLHRPPRILLWPLCEAPAVKEISPAHADKRLHQTRVNEKIKARWWLPPPKLCFGNGSVGMEENHFFPAGGKREKAALALWPVLHLLQCLGLMVRWEAACPGCCVLKAEQSFQWSTTNSSSSPSSGLTGPVALTKVSLSLMSIMPELVPASPCMSSWETMSTRVRSSHTCCMWAAPSHVHHPLRLPRKQPLSAPGIEREFLQCGDGDAEP